MATAAAASDVLPSDHPGFADAAYRERRRRITEVAQAYRPGDPIPEVHYSADEDAVWTEVATELARLHRDLACGACLRGRERLGLPVDRVPQLCDVDARLSSLTGFRLRPAAGLVPLREFYGCLAERTFCSTQYIRHHSTPFYTPEPDVIHEIAGHANMLADADFAAVYEAAGRASRRAVSEEALDAFSRVFWFTLEFGVVWEGGGLRAYGAGLLSSFGEIQRFRRAEIRPWDFAAMAATAYDITQYQPVLFAAPGPHELVDELGTFFESFSDDTLGAWRQEASP